MLLSRGLRSVGLVFLAAAVAGAAAQNVGGLRQASWDLPVTASDNVVVSEFFGALQAVQSICPESLRVSLAAEQALAACARLGQYFMADLGRSMVEMAFITNGSWASPWQENQDFGTVRRLAHQGAEYFLAINEANGLAYVIRFEN